MMHPRPASSSPLAIIPYFHLFALLSLFAALQPAFAAFTTSLRRDGDYVEANSKGDFCFYPAARDVADLDVACTGALKGDFAAVMDVHLNTTESIGYYSASLERLGGASYPIVASSSLLDRNTDTTTTTNTDTDTTDTDDTEAENGSNTTTGTTTGTSTRSSSTGTSTGTRTGTSASTSATPITQRKVYLCMSGRAGDYTYRTMCTTVSRDNSLGEAEGSPKCEVMVAQKRVTDGCYLPNQSVPEVSILGGMATTRVPVVTVTRTGSDSAKATAEMSTSGAAPSVGIRAGFTLAALLLGLFVQFVAL